MMHYEHLVRRGVEVMRDNSGLPEDVPPQIAQVIEAIKDMPQWGIYILFTTLLAGVLLIASVSVFISIQNPPRTATNA